MSSNIYIDTSPDHITPCSLQLKPMIKEHFPGRMVSSGISDIAFASVYSEKTRLKKLMMMMKMMMMMMMIIIMNKSQEMTFFSGRQKLTSAMKLSTKRL